MANGLLQLRIDDILRKELLIFTPIEDHNSVRKGC